MRMRSLVVMAAALSACTSVSGVGDNRTGIRQSGAWVVERFDNSLSKRHYCLATRQEDDGGTVGMVKTQDGAGPVFGWPVTSGRVENPTITYRLNTRQNYAPSGTASVFGRYYAIVYPAGSGDSALNDFVRAAQITYYADDPALGRMGPYRTTGSRAARALLDACYDGTW
jgi:hypothetical protein